MDVGLVQVYLPLKGRLRIGRQDNKGRLLRITRDLVLRLDTLLVSGVRIKNDLFAREKGVLLRHTTESEAGKKTYMSVRASDTEGVDANPFRLVGRERRRLYRDRQLLLTERN